MIEDMNPISSPLQAAGIVQQMAGRYPQVATVLRTIEEVTAYLATATGSQRALAMTKSEREWRQQAFEAECMGAPEPNCRFINRMGDVRQNLDRQWHARAVVKSIQRHLPRTID